MKVDVYRKTLLLAHTAWWSTAGIVALRGVDLIPQQLGLVALLTLGGAVSASLALSRMRLAQTITGVFQVGLQSAISLSANVFTDTCIMVIDGDCIVLDADHADAIGWGEGAIIGQDLRTLLTPRSSGVRAIRPGTSMTSPMKNQKGDVFDARFSFASVHADSDNESTIVTVSPVVAINTEGNYR